MNARRWAFLVAILSALAARLIAHFALRDVPHAMDEIAYVFQARTYLTGHVTAPVALPRAAFASWLIDDDTTRYGVFRPGWPAILALGTLVHLRAWVNPILHGLTTWIVSKSARRIGGPRARILAALVYGFSPQALFLAASLMPQTLIALGAACALWSGIAANTVKTRRRSLAIGGAGVAIAMLSHPISGIVILIGFAALVLLALHRRKMSADFLVAPLLPIALGIIVRAAYNQAVTGSGSISPQNVWLDAHAMPLGGLGHALFNTGSALSSWLFLAGGGPLAFLAPLFLIFVARERSRSRLLTLGATIPAAIVLYVFDRDVSPGFGAQFYQVALPALLMMGALALSQLDRFKKNATRLGSIVWLVLALPGFVVGAREMSDRYLGLDDRFVQVERTWNHGTAIVMVAFKNDGLRRHDLEVTGSRTRDPNPVWHNRERVQSALTLDKIDTSYHAWLLFTKFHPALVSELRDHYPNRAFYIYFMADLPENDRFEAYNPNKWANPDALKPPDDFDGYVVNER
ncbi:MAG: glycosyltransferase family 39 protein [Polyangiaceae bacterium]